MGVIVWYFYPSTTEDLAKIPKSHPAYGFYQIAKNGSTSLAVCESYGGREIIPNDYEQIEHLGQGVFTLRQISTGKKYLGVSFGVGEVIVKIKCCCWEIENGEDFYSMQKDE